MSEWKLRHSSEKKDPLLGRIALYITTVVVLASVVGGCAAFYYLPGMRSRSFYSRRANDIAMRDRKPDMTRRFKIGAAAGGAIGVLSCFAMEFVARRHKADQSSDD